MEKIAQNVGIKKTFLPFFFSLGLTKIREILSMGEPYLIRAKVIILFHSPISQTEHKSQKGYLTILAPTLFFPFF